MLHGTNFADQSEKRVTHEYKTRAVTGTQTELFRLRLRDQGWKLLDLEVENEVIEEKQAGKVN